MMMKGMSFHSLIVSAIELLVVIESPSLRAFRVVKFPSGTLKDPEDMEESLLAFELI
jgi:hypothetical protein